MAEQKKRTTKDYEGFRDKVYKDPSGKNRSVGYGINIDDESNKGLIPDDVIKGKRPLTKDEGEISYNAKMKQAQSAAQKTLGKKYSELDDEAREVVDDMYYNMGESAAKKFKGLHKALNAGDYKRAADEIQFSDAYKKDEETPYYKQTGNRAKDHVERMRRAAERKELGDEMVRQLE